MCKHLYMVSNELILIMLVNTYMYGIPATLNIITCLTLAFKHLLEYICRWVYPYINTCECWRVT